jgi:GT2 family glycosyltransferase
VGPREGIHRKPQAKVGLDVVIVVADGCGQYLEACLTSLEAHPPGSGARIFVVDNASSDGSVEIARRHGVELVSMGRNAGFSAANNAAMAIGTAPYVLLLNPDTEVPEGALGQLLGALEADPGLGAVGPRLVDRVGIPDHNAKRAFPTPSDALKHFLGRSRIAASSAYRTPDVAEDAVADVDAISGACMMVRRAALADVGLLDEGFWMYGEDLDWCLRFHRGGWRVRYVGSATVLHVKGGASGPSRGLRVNYAFHRAMARFYRKHQSGRPLLDLAVYLGILGRLLATSVMSMVARARGRT